MGKAKYLVGGNTRSGTKYLGSDWLLPITKTDNKCLFLMMLCMEKASFFRSFNDKVSVDI